MSDASLKRLLETYDSRVAPQMFLHSMGVAPAENFYKGDSIERDFLRQSKAVSYPLPKGETGYHLNQSTKYTNKSYTGIPYKEATPINAEEITKRQPGQINFSDPQTAIVATKIAFKAMQNMEDMMRRAMEIQAAQVMLTGKISLKDPAGTVVYAEDFKPKSTHFVTVNTLWSNSGATIIADIDALVKVIINDGGLVPDQIITDSETIETILGNAAIQKRLDLRNVELGSLGLRAPNGQGGVYHGQLVVGAYRLDLWSYGATYVDVTTGLETQYIPKGKVIVKNHASRFDCTYGAYARLVPIDQRVLSFLPGAFGGMGGTSSNFGFSANAWTDQTGENVHVGIATKFLFIPTAIDTYGCLTVLS